MTNSPILTQPLIHKQKQINFLSKFDKFGNSTYCNAVCAQTDMYMLIIAKNILIISALTHKVMLMHHSD